ncbi:MAG: gamma-glutamyl-gamma-aminobutyrate hydrolase family protein [Candidatus Dormibacteria bacterium]
MGGVELPQGGHNPGIPLTDRPIVGVTLSPLGLPSGEAVYQFGGFGSAVRHAGGVPLFIDPFLDTQALRDLYDLCDAILLPGGIDLDPNNYDQQPLPDVFHQPYEPELDRTDLQLAKWAVADGKPVLGACRGAQVLCVALGGTLWQDLNAQHVTTVDHAGTDIGRAAHEINIVSGSLLGRLTLLRHVRVNSRHHQAARELGAGLRVIAQGPDGVIEAFEGTGKSFVLGVQFHPEALPAKRWSQRIFSGLTSAAREFRQSRGISVGAVAGPQPAPGQPSAPGETLS